MPQFPQNVFRAYDIRGIRHEEITPEFATLLGRSLAARFESKQVVVGYDARPGCVEFAPFVMEGLAQQGADVLSLGMVPTELVPITSGLKNINEAIIITASHNPPQYVGFKLLTNQGATGITDANGRLDMIAMMTDPSSLPTPAKQGAITEYDPWDEYVNHLFSLVSPSKLQRPLNVLGEAGNGMGGVLINHLAAKLPIKLNGLLFEPDGNYPSHTPNPILPQSRKLAESEAKKASYDLTVMLDGDADRAAFLDETGVFIPADYFDTVIMDKIIHPLYPDSPVVSENRRAWALDFGAKATGYQVIRAKTGYPNIKAAMRENNAAFGFETSAHTMYRDTFFAESSGLTFLYILQLLNQTNGKLSELVAPYRNQVAFIDELNYHHDDSKKALDAMAAAFADAKISYPDGIVLETDTWRTNVRTSNTEPLLRLNLEARTDVILQEQLEAINKVITESGGAPESH